jgi:hypothetical protein
MAPAMASARLQGRMELSSFPVTRLSFPRRTSPWRHFFVSRRDLFHFLLLSNALEAGPYPIGPNPSDRFAFFFTPESKDVLRRKTAKKAKP